MTTIEKNTPPTYLAELNRHPRDEFITFDEGPHVYTVHGDSTFTSVTTFNHSHFEEFNADEVIDKIQTQNTFNNLKLPITAGERKQFIKSIPNENTSKYRYSWLHETSNQSNTINMNQGII